MSRRSFFASVMFSVAAFASDVPLAVAESEPTNVAIVRDGIVVDGLAIARGRTASLAVAVDGRTGTSIVEPVVWSASPEGVLGLRDQGGGRVSITPLRDNFDDPSGREPRVVLSVCVKLSCRTIGVVCLIDMSGRWRAHIDVSHAPIKEDRDVSFAQDGRTVVYESIRIRLDGSNVRLVTGGGRVTRVNGTFTSRNEANGTWTSTYGLTGTWRMVRQP